MSPVTGEGRVPIIKLRRDLVVVLQGALDDRLVNQLKDEITTAIERYDSDGVVISVNGIELMDSHISRVIYDVAHIARIMGVDTVVSGIHSLVATTLVQMGLDVAGVPTELNVERALDRLAEIRRARRAPVVAESEDDDDSEDEEGREPQSARPRRSRGEDA